VIIESTLQPWDVAALVPIVENAGGILTDWSGAPAPQSGRIVAAGDARVHAEVLELLAEYRE
jgi:myo-inositol-1(or 4)-monophosphatase